MIRVEEVNDIYQLAGYRLLWSALLGKTRSATFFQSLDWLEVYWRHFAGGGRLRVLVIYSDRRPIGILPLVVQTERTRVGPVRVLTYPLHGWGTFYGPIGPNPTATLTAGLRHIRQTRRDWDLLDLRWVDSDGCDRGRTQAAMRQAGFFVRKQAWAQAAVIDMQGTWAQYWQGRTRKWQENVRRCRRRLAEQGKVTFLRYRPEGLAHGDADPRWDLYDQCLRIAQRSWQGSSTGGTTLSHSCVRQYLRETHAAAVRTGSLDLNLLLLFDQPVAFIYNYYYQGRVYGLRKGFDPKLAAARPGTVLQAAVLEDSFKRGDCHYDMGENYLDVKRHWQTSVVTSYRFSHFPIAVARVQLLRIKRWLQDRLCSNQCAACSPTA